MTGTARVARGRRGTAATLTALVGLAVTTWGAAEAISLARHRRTFWLSAPDVTRWARHTRFADDSVLVIGLVAAALGVLLLAAAVVPPRRRLVELVEDDPAVATGIGRRSLRRTLAAAAVEIDGVSAATVRGRRRLRVRVTTALHDADTLPDRVRERVTERLDGLAPARPHPVRVRLAREDA